MAIDNTQLRRRLVAARELRGVTQARLTELGADYGLGKTEAGRVERGTITWTRKHTRAFADILRVPERWFTEPDTDVLIWGGEREAATAAFGGLGDLSAAPTDADEQQQPQTRPSRSA